MKVYLSGYRSHWISPYTVIDYIFFWKDWSKCSRNKGVIADEDYVDHPEWVEKCTKYIKPICEVIQSVLDFIHPPIKYVKIDRYDTWSMDYTLAYIILPMLKQLKEESHGSPWIDDEDVPVELRSTKKKRKSKRHADPNIQMLDMDEDDMIHKRWAWVLDEMIWAFELKVQDDPESQFFDYSESGNKLPWDEGYVAPKVDWDGLNAHNERKRNAFRLFGKYYENLWD
jgi:hypothetical protein